MTRQSRFTWRNNKGAILQNIQELAGAISAVVENQK
jgi:hypothetical protein